MDHVLITCKELYGVFEKIGIGEGGLGVRTRKKEKMGESGVVGAIKKRGREH